MDSDSSAERSRAALARIENALARIEAAARAPRPAPTPVESAGSSELAALQARHERLRGRVGEALAELDTLIAGVAE